MCVCVSRERRILLSSFCLLFSVKLDVVVVDEAVVSLGGVLTEGGVMEFGAGLDG